MTNMGGKPVGTEGILVLFSEQNSLCLKPFDSGDDYQNLSSEAALFFILIIWFTNCQLFSPQKNHIKHPVLHPPSPPNPPQSSMADWALRLPRPPWAPPWRGAPKPRCATSWSRTWCTSAGPWRSWSRWRWPSDQPIVLGFLGLVSAQ